MQAKKTKSKQIKIEEPQLYSQLAKTYYSDLSAPNMLYAKIIRCTIGKGKIKSINCETLPENYYFFTAKDFGNQNYVETLDIQTEILADSEIYYKGQPFGILAGPDFREFEEIEKSISIELIKDATKNKEKEFPYAQRFIRNGKANKPEEFAKLFSKKNYDIKGTWTSVLNAPSCNETNGAFCNYEKNVLTISTPTQWPKHLQDNIKRVFDLKTDQIVIKKTISSGPHTNTIWLNTVNAIQASLVAIKTGRPVLLVLSRMEHFEFLTKKSPVTIKIRSSVRKKDGIIDATQILIELDSGYRNPFAAEILDRLVIAANNIYSVRNLEIIAKAYESYNAPVSFNIECIDSQAFFAIENQMQKISNVTGFLPDEIRMKNFERKLSMPFTFTNEKVRESFSAIVKQSDLNRKFISYRLEASNRKIDLENIENFPLRGIGLACGFNGVGYYGSNIFACNQKMEATLESDGTLIIHALPPSNSTLEVWKNTAAEILDIDQKQIKLDSNFDVHDELSVPENVYSNIAIMTYLLKRCCLDIQSKRFKKPLPISSSKGFTAAQKRVWNKDKFTGVPFFASSFGTLTLELELNPYTYKIYIKSINAIISAGKINLPKVAENYVKLSIEHALSELIENEPLHCDKIRISFVQSENDPAQLDGLISRILPAAFSSALSQASGNEINTIPVKPQNFFKEMISK